MSRFWNALTPCIETVDSGELEMNIPEYFRKYDFAIAFLWLATLSFLAFSEITKSSGFYLDDWSMLKIFYFGPTDFWGMSRNYLLSWPLITLRPVQAPFHAAMYCLFGMVPFGYHVTAAVMDVFSAALFYVIVKELFYRRDVAIIAASLALVDPRHDTTHNWVLCSSVALSQLLTMLSIWLAVIGSKRNDVRLKLVSMLPFALMVWNYETFLPMAPLNAFILSDGVRRFDCVRRFVLWGSYYSIPVVLLLAFHKFLLPLLVKPTIHQVIFDIKEICSTMWDGLLIQIAPSTFSFFLQQIALNMADLPTRSHVIICVAIVVLSIYALLYWGKDERQLKPGLFLRISVSGLVVIVLSYTIFGLNKEYHPGISTIFNRVNTGGVWGGALIVAAILVAIGQLFRVSMVFRSVAVGAALSALLVLYIAVGWCFDRPWISSWRTQKNIQKVLSEDKTLLKSGDAVLLLNCPRYVNWTPVFDGVWDFERMVQITRNNSSILGNVVSERLSINSTTLTDIALGNVVGTYPLCSTYLLAPAKRTLLKVRDAHAFVDEVEQNGMKFGLDPLLPARWRESLKK